jgi:hypothetical protein
MFRLEKRWKEQKRVADKSLQTEHRVQHEVGKKENRAIKAAAIQQRKIEHKKQHIDQKISHSAPRNPIMQPDKNTKSR